MKALGIDLGTTSISMLMLDAGTGEVLGSKTIQSRAYMETPRPWSREQDPEKIYGLVLEGLQDMTARYGRPDAIGMTGQMHGMLYVNAEGQAVSPLYTWEDGSGNEPLPAQEGETAVSLLKKAGLFAASGFGLTTHFYHVKTGKVPEGAAKMTTISDYVAMRLCGNTAPVIAVDMGASWGCFDLENGCFATERLAELGVDPSILTEMKKSHSVIGTVSSDKGIAAGAAVTASLGDNQASYLGAVKDMRSSVLINVGTGSQVSCTIDRYVDIRGSVELRPCTEDLFLLAGSGLCGGRAYAMLENFYRMIVQDALCAADVKAEYDGYAMMERQARDFIARTGEDEAWKVRTTFNGTRSDPLERGSISNISGKNFVPGAMTLGMLRGVMGELHGMYGQMCELTGSRATAMVGSGNGIRKNALLRETAERMFGCTMQIPAHQEEAAYGAAITALTGAGLFPDLASAQEMIRYL